MTFRDPPQVDCLRLDFGLVPGTKMPRFSVAVIGQSRRDVLGWRQHLIQKMGCLPNHEKWMSAPDEDAFASASLDPERRDEMDEETGTEA